MLPGGGTEKIRRLRESKDVKHGLMKGIDDDVDGDGDGLTHPSLGQGGGEKGTTNDGDRVREVGRRESPLTGGGPSSSVSPLRGTIATFEFEDSKDRLENYEATEDVVLEDMSAALGRLKVLSQNMSFNLQEQKDMLEDTQNIAEDSSSRFGRVERKIDYVLNKAGLPYWKIIFILVIIMILLLLAIVYL